MAKKLKKKTKLRGPAGPRGRRGPRGYTGSTGASGTSLRIAVGSESFGYVFQIGPETGAVGAPVNFSNNGPLNGINHTAGRDSIGITLDGTYNITFSVYTTNNNPQDWAIAVNGVYTARFNSAGQTITGTTSLNLNAGDRVTIRNVNTFPNPATLRSSDTITAYVLIYKISA